MNKKVVLSVLSTAVVASMAASAFAAPKQGLYIGGNVKKFYSTSTLLNMTKDARTTYKNELKTAGFQNLVFVNIKGQGATIKEMIDLGTKVALADPLKQSDFLDSYGVVQNDGTVNGTEVPKVDPVPTDDLKVESVSAINSAQIEIKFNTAVKASTVVASATAGAEVKGTLVDGAITVNSLDGNTVNINSAVAALSTDGKTLTLTAVAGEKFAGRYDVKVAEGAIKSANDKIVAKFETTINVADATAPVVASTTQVAADKVKVTFSEPLSTLGTVTFKLADGTPVQTGGTGVTISHVAGSNEATFTLGSDVAAKKDVVATFVGTQDFAGNLISPNPATATLHKGDVDGTAPTVSTVTVVDASKFEVKFSEPLQTAAPVISIVSGDGGALTVTQDSTDKSKFVVTTTTPVTGLQTISVAAGYKDLSGEAGAAFSKVVNFTTDTTAPTLVSANTVSDSNVQYLEVTFNENVVALPTLANIAVTGTKVKDFVTTPVAVTGGQIAANKFVPVTDNEKVFRIKLSDLLAGDDVEGAVYSLTLTGKDAGAATVALVEDKFGNDGQSTLTATVTRGVDGTPSNTNRATIDTSVGTNGIDVVNTNTLTVGFNQPLDGPTATNPANYTIAGAVVEKAILNPVIGGKQTVTLKLKADSNTFSGLRNVTISGVKAKDGLVMEEYKTTESLNENVAPTITKAVLTTPNTVTLTFSEAVTNAAADTNDFELLIGGVKVASNDEITTAQQTTAATTLTLTLEAAVTADDLAKGLKIKGIDTIDVQDEVTNVAVVATPVTVQQ
ncbi:hypothetical protein [Brevibacillus parabrevis]|uniref:hypothetical protein n=1 Tax=Brevibacillus parabrevis TaxID=54914 RepID=UPI002E1E6F4F|nr:hypothetical protein [Brevibacillus parabrevis]